MFGRKLNILPVSPYWKFNFYFSGHLKRKFEEKNWIFELLPPY